MTESVTFDGAPAPGSINFGVGQPSPDLLPIALLERAARAFFAAARPDELNYGPPQGDERFRAVLAEFLGREHGGPATADGLCLSGGVSQALDLVCARLLDPGDVVFVEEPSYFLAFRIFADHRARVVGIPVDDEGLDVEALERRLTGARPRMVYTIPSFQNPSGVTLSPARRDRLLDLAARYGFVIVADEVYQSLWCATPPPPAFGTRADSDRVLSLGSFSKILAPGLRLGWIQTGPALMRRLLASGALNSGGNVNHVTSHIVRKAIELGLLEPHLDRLRSAYGRRIAVMDDALHEHVGARASWRRPDGGYFFWLRLTDGQDTRALREAALAAGSGFQPGAVFSPAGGLGDRLRLSFARYTESDIRAGVARFAALLQS